MSEFDSPNYAEYTYEKKSEGKTKTGRRLMLLLYILFAVAYFTVCCVTKLFVLIAIEPILVWMLVFFTWKYVSYDCYFVFNTGILEIGTARTSKNGPKSNPKHKIHVKDAEFAGALLQNEDILKDCKVSDFSESAASDKRIVIIYNNKGERTAVIFEGTARIANLLASFCPCAKELKGQKFHG